MGGRSARATKEDERLLTELERAAVGKRTDKLLYHSYLPVYDRLLSHLRDSEDPVLEIGAWLGGSLQMWSEYFTKARIYGCDVNDVPFEGDVDLRVKAIKVDAYCEYALKFLGPKGPFSVIVDDGPHTLESQVFFCANYPKLLAQGGCAVVEDVQSPHHLAILASRVPDGFESFAVDLCHVKGRYDDIAFFIWR